MKWKIGEVALALALTVTVLCGFFVQGKQEKLAENMIRLHVVADSDSREDQRLKLLVRDCILETLTPVLEKETEKDSSAKTIRALLPSLEGKAEATLRTQGCSDRVTATLQVESFPTREYDSFTLPAGYYTSLRIVIGSGRGHNWWCVVFPPLCTQAATAEDFQTLGLTEDESRWITEESRGYVLRFRLLEWMQELREAIIA